MNPQKRYYFSQVLSCIFLMNRKKLILSIIAGVMTISPVYAIAHAAEAGEMKTSIAVTLKGIPEDVEHGSIKVDEDAPEEQLIRLATVSIDQAITTAYQILQGQIIKAKLDEA